MRLLDAKYGVLVTEYLWRCNCLLPWHYLHLKDGEQCPRCGAHQDECLDATIDDFLLVWRTMREAPVKKKKNTTRSAT